ncbi:PIN domain-containing protein [Sphingomonas sp. MAH-20]|uniref:Ribonuclease VapC n=1 Tax=Sphingomonas horti TaxID=2682842 RepID=A0A6I4IZS1_9SPHN|nr:MULTISPECIES: type II toxin-antitoxin system VapC family toxin [Sphingomonas]MBA2919887.1 type II toxin-antitoxin system VapC family toxin [Sphingomonas sp. CGMCC 1.13658]MVO77770.1 PIN domain-containing protein [Sphingomonas horti]
MKLFIDASALVAILMTEPGFEVLSDAASAADQLFTSGLTRWETVRAMTRINQMSPSIATRQLEALLSRFDVVNVAIGEREAELAIEAHRQYGKGNHDARLNMGDCFAYACAKANGAKLLYKGGDFALTDLA